MGKIHRIYVQKCYINSLAQMESDCTLREGLMSFM